ncbi:MAG TPA: zf-HC2 domain-containing protein [Rhodopila sp.]|nr:zf-HC2 domain-containing protein [Rhodopila sp.]
MGCANPHPAGKDGTIPLCREMSELVTDYMEDALPLRMRMAAKLHLLRCPACTRYFDQMRRTIALLRRTRLPEPPEAVAEAVLRRLNSKSGDGQSGDGEPAGNKPAGDV